MSVVQEVAKALRQAEAGRTPIDPPSQTYPLDLEAAYSVQLTNALERAKRERLVGYKVGLTSRAAQAHFGVFEPDFGHLFASMEIPPDGEIAVGGLIQPKIEGEIAFVMGRPLKGPGVGMADALRAVDGALAAFEIIDSRIRDWKIGAADTIADNGSSARFVLGSRLMPLSQLDLPHLGMALGRNGEVQLTGAGAAVMGHPLNALVFLANELGKHDRGLEPGQVILSGALSGMLPVKGGEYFDLEIAHLGRVVVRAGEGS